MVIILNAFQDVYKKSFFFIYWKPYLLNLFPEEVCMISKETKIISFIEINL